MAFEWMSKVNIKYMLDKVKNYIDTKLNGKSNTDHTHDSRYYTETEIDSKISAINSDLANKLSNSTKYAAGDAVGGNANNALKLNGYASDTANTANTVVWRDGNKYIRAQYYNAACGTENINSYSGPLFAFFSTDGWLRKASVNNTRTCLGLQRQGWGTSLDCQGNHGLLIINSDLFVVWLSATSNIVVTSVGHWYFKETTNNVSTFSVASASGTGITLRRFGDKFTCTVSGNATITWIGF